MGLRSKSVEVSTGFRHESFNCDEIRGESRTKCMKSAGTSLSEIDSFRAIGERVGTAGQPTEDQFRAIRAAGFEVVINLALPTSDNALADEGSIVSGLGM